MSRWCGLMGKMDRKIEINRFSFVPTECALCGAADSEDRYCVTKFKQGELRFVTCKQCGTAYQDPMPSQESMQAFYHSGNFFKSKSTSEELTGYRDYDGEERIRQTNARRRLAEIEALFPSKSRIHILKVACGYGALVKHARDRGHVAEGIDFSLVMAEGAKRLYGIDLIVANFLDYDFGDRKYDAVVLYGAINNFLRPLDVARKVHALLVPGGYYVVNHVWLNSLPERILKDRYWIYRPPIIGLYPRKVFEQHHEALGFEVHKSRYDVQYLTLDKLFGYLQMKWVLRALGALRLPRFGFTLPVPGYGKVVFRKR